MITRAQLEKQKAVLEKERDEFVRNANAQVERYIGALAIIEKLIAESKEDESPNASDAG